MIPKEVIEKDTEGENDTQEENDENKTEERKNECHSVIVLCYVC